MTSETSARLVEVRASVGTPTRHSRSVTYHNVFAPPFTDLLPSSRTQHRDQFISLALYTEVARTTGLHSTTQGDNNESNCQLAIK